MASTDARQAPDKTSRKKRVSAGPEKKARSRPAVPEVDTDILMNVIHESLMADKAEDITVIDLIGRASFADKMVIATGLADRQIAAMAEHIEKKLKEAGVKRVWIEGEGGTDWVLLDAGDIVVHLFKAEARQHYALEKMWAPELDDDADN
ncbi:ribosome silencing factor [Candidatus Kirkpatrickella diaphorinae]|uniref:Ribosomal silencing factor RsfS n=1 Tax=Candidatus Kirkpatrickella diaphorinae TaxID=2984322 RepID=A0ABY6GLA1_9PROT|nr:ribosome silencing factor [Candidatus Kirkpatrickella diaphorinae]UYH52309.1 ribosome silencing factor [Candidatus Kirkpatrickella diaphorinae]